MDQFPQDHLMNRIFFPSLRYIVVDIYDMDCKIESLTHCQTGHLQELSS